MRLPVLLLLAATGGTVASGREPPALRQYAVQCAEHYAHVYRVPVELVEAVIDVESQWNAYAISPRGAVGLMQLMPKTAFVFRVRNRFWVEDNIRGGVAYLACLTALFKGDLRLVMAAYVVGQDRILAHGLVYSSREVYEYVNRVAKRYRSRCLETRAGGRL